MSQIQTANWLDKPEDYVITKLGPYKTKALNDKGYVLIFDYSTYNRSLKKNQNNDNYEVHVGPGNYGQIIPPTTYVNTWAKPALDVNQYEIIKEKVLKFYFDNNKNVIYVDAIGYPDSVRYEPRKK